MCPVHDVKSLALASEVNPLASEVKPLALASEINATHLTPEAKAKVQELASETKTKGLTS